METEQLGQDLYEGARSQKCPSEPVLEPLELVSALEQGLALPIAILPRMS